jgi:hypothetical protein
LHCDQSSLNADLTRRLAHACKARASSLNHIECIAGCFSLVIFTRSTSIEGSKKPDRGAPTTVLESDRTVIRTGLGRKPMNAVTAILSIFAASAAVTLAITALANS